MPKTRFLHARMSRRLDALSRSRLWLQVLIGLFAGVAVGIALGPDFNLVSRDAALVLGGWLALPGRLFLAAIGMVIIPLASSSIVLGVAGAGGGDTLRAIGRRLALFVLSTTIVAAAIGATLARLVRPGRGVVDVIVPTPRLKPDPETVLNAASPIENITRELPDLIANLIPQNITVSLVEQDMLAIVVFSLLIGVAAVNADKKELTKPLVALAEAVLEISMTVIRTAMRFAPVAVFGLIAQTTAANGVQTLADLAVYCGVVLAGLTVLLVLYLVIAASFGAMSPLAFLRAVAPVQVLAFSTSSSAAVMPLTMKTAVEKLGAAPSVAGAVIPLASTVNMAGTALYQCAAIVFMADIGGATLSNGDLALIMITLTGASIGAPAAPGASIAILAATASNFGVPLIGLPLVVGVDRILDMVRTSVNVTGDLVLCRILSPKAPLRAAGAGDKAAGADAATGSSETTPDAAAA